MNSMNTRGFLGDLKPVISHIAGSRKRPARLRPYRYLTSRQLLNLYAPANGVNKNCPSGKQEAIPGTTAGNVFMKSTSSLFVLKFQLAPVGETEAPLVHNPHLEERPTWQIPAADPVRFRVVVFRTLLKGAGSQLSKRFSVGLTKRSAILQGT